jgi:hypothetical protein
MDAIIIEYICDLCQVKGGVTIFFDGSKIYYDTLKKHLGDLFDLEGYEVDGYMITSFYEMDRDFDYMMFTCCLAPKMDGYIYAPYIPMMEPEIVDGDFEPNTTIMSRYATRMVNDRFYGSLDTQGIIIAQP